MKTVYKNIRANAKRSKRKIHERIYNFQLFGSVVTLVLVLMQFQYQEKDFSHCDKNSTVASTTPSPV